MRIKSALVFGFFALAAAALHAQPINGPVYWSTTAPDCTSIAGESPVTIISGTTIIGYSCYVSGTFVWLAAGGGWGSAIRVAAPASAAVGVDYTFYDNNGKNLTLDTSSGSASSVASTNEVSFALSANQPAEVDLLGATTNAPNYSATSTGSVYAVFYCPDATTCANLLPQLLYSELPTNPWSLSVPIAWDTALWTQWSAEGIDDGRTHRVSLAIYNEDFTATSYVVRVYDSTGALAATGATPSIPPLQNLGNGMYGEGGTYGALLSDVIGAKLPAGIFKVLVDGGSKYSAIEVLEIDGPSATSLQVAYDSTVTAKSRIRNQRVESTPKPLFHSLAP